MSGFQFFQLSKLSSPKPSSPAEPTKRVKSSLELFAEFVGDGESTLSYEFPPLEVLEFDARSYDSFETLDEPSNVVSPATFEIHEQQTTESDGPYVFNHDEEMELRLEVAFFSSKVDDGFKVAEMAAWGMKHLDDVM